jgi:peptidoglycan/LPS O-acetylase OafA/YrhL
MPALDGLRGLAILLALFHHFAMVRPEEPRQGLIALADFGKFGLDIFFVLSGFLITGILLDTRNRPHYFRNFYARRTLRVFPLYYAVLAFFFLALPWIHSRSQLAYGRAQHWGSAVNDWPWYLGYLSNVLFTLRDGFGPSGLDLTWSLAIEEQFYLVWAVLIFFTDAPRLMRISAILVILAPIVRIGMWLAGGSWIQIHVFTPCRLDGIALGSFLASAMRSPGYDSQGLLKWARRIALGASAGLVALFPWGGLRETSMALHTLGYSLVVFLCAGGLFLSVHANPKSLAGRLFGGSFLRFFGKYSYAMYLFHLPVRDLLTGALYPLSWVPGVPGSGLIPILAFMVLCSGLTLIPAFLSWHLFEKHFLRLKKNFDNPRR